MSKLQLTTVEAQLLIDMLDVDIVLDDAEEYDLLKENNPELLTVYVKLRKIAEENEM